MKKEIKNDLHEQEIKLIYYCRKIEYGDIHIQMYDGKPKIIKKSTENLRLDLIDLDKLID